MRRTFSLVRNSEVATSRVVACPEGITRATVLEICRTQRISQKETDLTLEDVYRADEDVLYRHNGRIGRRHHSRRANDRKMAKSDR